MRKLTDAEQRRLDIAVHRCIAGEPDDTVNYSEDGSEPDIPTWLGSEAPCYTLASSGEAMRLLERGLPNGWTLVSVTRRLDWDQHPLKWSDCAWDATICNDERNPNYRAVRGLGPTPCIAVCLAVLRAYGADTKEWE